MVGVAGRALRQKEHGIADPHRVGVVNLAEELAGIGKLRLEAGEHLFAHRVAAATRCRGRWRRPDPQAGSRIRASCGPCRSRRCVSPFLASRRGRRLQRGACGRQPGRECSRRSGCPAAGRAHRSSGRRPSSGTCRGSQSPAARRQGAPDWNESGGGSTSGVAGSPVTASASSRRFGGHSSRVVVGSKAKIQLARCIVSAIGAAEAAAAGAEAVPEPVRLFPARNRQPLDSIGRDAGKRRRRASAPAASARSKRMRRVTPAALPRRLRLSPACSKSASMCLNLPARGRVSGVEEDAHLAFILSGGSAKAMGLPSGRPA